MHFYKNVELMRMRISILSQNTKMYEDNIGWRWIKKWPYGKIKFVIAQRLLWAYEGIKKVEKYRQW